MVTIYSSDEETISYNENIKSWQVKFSIWIACNELITVFIGRGALMDPTPIGDMALKHSFPVTAALKTIAGYY